jgi:flagellar hook-length control protein FliK
MLDGKSGPAFCADVLSAIIRHAVCSVIMVGTLLADRSCPGVIVMQPSVSVVQQSPTAASSMPLVSTTPVVAGKLPSATNAFGDALGKLLAAVAAAHQPAAPTVAATAITQATTDPPATVPTLQPDQTSSAPPVALALPPPETVIRAPSDTGTSKASPETLPARRGTFPRVTRASMPVDQQALPTDVLAVPTPLPDNAPEHVAPAAPRHHAEALEQKEVAVSTAPPPPTVAAQAAPTSVSTPSPLPQDAQAATRSAALPAVEPTLRLPAALPETAAPSTPSNLAATRSPSHTASPARQFAPVVRSLPPQKTAIGAPRGAETPKALPDSTLQHAAPAAPQNAEAPEQKELFADAPSPQIVEAPAAPMSLSADATTSPSPQDAQAAAPAQSAALPAAELTPRAPAGVPTVAPSVTSKLAAAMSPSQAASPAAQFAPVASTLPSPETAIRAPSDTGSSKAPPESQPVRRGTYPRGTSVSVPVDRQAFSTDVPPFPAAAPLPDNRSEQAAPAVPRQHAEAPEQKEVVKAAPSPQTVEAPATPMAVSVDATPPQAAQAAAPVQSAALPAVELTVPAVLPEAAAPSTPSSLITAAAPSHAASPAAQIAPALVQMGHAADGAQRLTVRLDPPELGHVQVRIDRPAEAAARVEITVEKPETLTLLLRDQPQLQHALDLAGVPSEGRSVTFHIASPEPTPRSSEPATAPAPGVAAGGLSNDGSHGTPRQGGQSGRQQPSAQGGSETEFTPISPTGWLRGGLDITA